jgi:hypothetical protein
VESRRSCRKKPTRLGPCPFTSTLEAESSAINHFDTGKTLGLTIPPPIMVRAEQVIE